MRPVKVVHEPLLVIPRLAVIVDGVTGIVNVGVAVPDAPDTVNAGLPPQSNMTVPDPDDTVPTSVRGLQGVRVNCPGTLT